MGIKGLTTELKNCWKQGNNKKIRNIILDGKGWLYQEVITKISNEEKMDLLFLRKIIKKTFNEFLKKYDIKLVVLDGCHDPKKYITHYERNEERWKKGLKKGNCILHPLTLDIFKNIICECIGKAGLWEAILEADPIIDKLAENLTKNKRINVTIMTCDSDFYKFIPNKKINVINYKGLELCWRLVQSYLDLEHLSEREWNYALKQFSND